MTKFVTQKGIWLLVALLAFSMMACTDEESKTIAAIGSPSPIQMTADVQGMVRDLCTGEAIANVKVSMAYNGGVHTVTTGTSGLYAFNDVPVNTSEALTTECSDCYPTYGGGCGCTIPNEGGQVDSGQDGDSYTVVADFTEYLERYPDMKYRTTYVGYVTLVYESMHDSIADMAEKGAISTSANTYNLTITGSGAARPVHGLAGGLDIMVSEANASLTIKAVRSAIDNSTIAAASFGLYAANAAYGSCYAGNADDIFVQTISWAGSEVKVSNLEGGVKYYLRLLDEELAFFNDRNMGAFEYAASTTDAPCNYFGGSCNDLTLDTYCEDDYYTFDIHCNENAILKCIALMPAPCLDIVRPWVVDYSPKHLAEASNCSEITVMFSECMNTDYPPVEQNAEEFLGVAVLDQRAGGNIDLTHLNPMSDDDDDMAVDSYVFVPLSISAVWTTCQMLTITIDTEVPVGSRLMVFFNGSTPLLDVAGNTLIMDAMTAMTVGAALHVGTFNQNHSGIELGNLYAWATGDMMDWLYYCPCEAGPLALNDPFDNGEYIMQMLSTSGAAYLKLAWNKVLASIETGELACVADYYVFAAADPTCEFPKLIAEVGPVGNPATSWEGLISDIVQVAGIGNWTDFNTSINNFFYVWIAALNCDNELGPLVGPLMVLDITGPCIDYSAMCNDSDDDDDTCAEFDENGMTWGFMMGDDDDDCWNCNGLALSCTPPAGYVDIVMDSVISESADSIADANFAVISQALEECEPVCSANNLEDPIITFCKLDPSDMMTIVLNVDDIWLMDSYDLISVGGMVPSDGVTGVRDGVGNICQSISELDYCCAAINVEDDLNPVLHAGANVAGGLAVAKDGNSYNPDWEDAESEAFYDDLVLWVAEEVNFIENADGSFSLMCGSYPDLDDCRVTWNVGGAPQSMNETDAVNQAGVTPNVWAAGVGVTTSSGVTGTNLVPVTIAGVRYPRIDYINGKTRFSLKLPDGALDMLLLGDAPWLVDGSGNNVIGDMQCNMLMSNAAGCMAVDPVGAAIVAQWGVIAADADPPSIGGLCDANRDSLIPTGTWTTTTVGRSTTYNAPPADSENYLDANEIDDECGCEGNPDDCVANLQIGQMDWMEGLGGTPMGGTDSTWGIHITFNKFVDLSNLEIDPPGDVDICGWTIGTSDTVSSALNLFIAWRWDDDSDEDGLGDDQELTLNGVTGMAPASLPLQFSSIQSASTDDDDPLYQNVGIAE